MTKFNLGWPLKKAIQKESHRALAPILKGFRIELRAPAMEDYLKWSAVRAANQDFLQPYEPKWAEDCLTQEFFERRLTRQKNDLAKGRGCYFLIHLKHNKNIIGGINLNNINMGAARHASLGYWLAENFQGQGYMSEAGKLVIDYSFNVLALRRLNAGCLPDNEPSVRLLQRLGFEEEGYAKKYLQINGQWQDHRLFGLINNVESTAS